MRAATSIGVLALSISACGATSDDDLSKARADQPDAGRDGSGGSTSGDSDGRASTSDAASADAPAGAASATDAEPNASPQRDAAPEAAPPDAHTQTDSGPSAPSVCTDMPCLCDALAACEPARFEAPLPLGSQGVRVCGPMPRPGGGPTARCAVVSYDETEGGVTMRECLLPSDVDCADDPFGASSPYCLDSGSCNVLVSSCPPDLLDCAGYEPSCSPTNPGNDDCCSGYAVLTTTGTCGCACLQGDYALYATLSECESACEI